jgi:hypothetical protein
MKQFKLAAGLLAIAFLGGIVLSQNSITVQKPQKDAIWRQGSVHTIVWTKTGAMDSQVKIRLYDSAGVHKILGITDSCPNIGSFSWVIPNSAPLGQFIIRVKTVDNAVFDDGGKFFIKKKWIAQLPIDVMKKPKTSFPVPSDTFKVVKHNKLKTIQVGVWINDRSKARYQAYDVGSSIEKQLKIGDEGETELVKVPGTVRVGYENNYLKKFLGKWSYWGYILRSKLTFDLEPIRGHVVTKAILEFTKHHTFNSNCNQGNCYKALYRLTSPWGDFMSIPGEFIGILQGGNKLSMDITADVSRWLLGTQEENGLLIIGWEEGFAHNNKACVSWYYPKLTVTYLTKD